MDPKEFGGSPSGRCIRSVEGYWAFVPNPLPPIIKYDERLIYLLSEAQRLLGELSGAGGQLPNPYLLINPYVRREAVSSSAIEGTQATLDDLFLFEVTGTEEPRVSDVKEVLNYVKAMNHGLQRLEKLPLSTRLVREIHEVLMEGERATPGSLRRSQNWIGPPSCLLDNATYVPPPPKEMRDGLDKWEKYLHSNAKEPPLVQCALMHYHFEALHPFLDGHGRVGRLLITFFLCERKYLSKPLLYLSAFFEKYKNEYYSRLLSVSKRGDWEGWLEYFLRGVIRQTEDAISDAKKILKLHERYQNAIKKTKRVPDAAYRLVDEIFLNPIVSISRLSKKWNIPFNSVKTGVQRLLDVGILVETGFARKRNKLFVALELMKLLSSADKRTE